MPAATLSQTPDQIEVSESKNPAVSLPEFVEKIQADYLARAAHVFLVTGNVFDYMDPMGSRMFLLDMLAAKFDTAVKRANAAEARKLGVNISVKDKKVGVLGYYEAGRGLQFLSKRSEDAYLELMKAFYNDEFCMQNNLQMQPRTFYETMETLNWFFEASKKRKAQNKAVRDEALAMGRDLASIKMEPEINFTIAFIDSQFNTPAGDVAHMERDREFIAMFRAWSRDLELGNSNKVVLVAPSLASLNEEIRSSDAFIKHVSVKRPNLRQREEWLTNYDGNLKRNAEGGMPQKVDGKPWTHIELAEGETLKDIAIISAGMNLKQLEGPILAAATANVPLSMTMVRDEKQRILETEYGGVIEFFEPTKGYEIIGGHEHLKRYGYERIINPLLNNQKDICSRGVILTGPPGTGKTEWALATAFESKKLNFILAHFDKLKDGIVGSSEKLMRKFLEAVRAAAPCMLFIDEIDSVFGVHAREGARDGGVQSNEFNSFMTFLSDPSRIGEIVVIAATNRPDMLDSALIRPGRFDDMIPTLPPRAGDIEGRTQILFAIMNRKKVKFAEELKGTQARPNIGLGKLTHDPKIWTGAEINKLVEDAVLSAKLATETRKSELGKKYRFEITTQDWDDAMRFVKPKTGQVESMTKLSLLFMNNLRYCPVGWEDTAADTSALRKELESASRGFSLEDRE